MGCGNCLKARIVFQYLIKFSMLWDKIDSHSSIQDNYAPRETEINETRNSSITTEKYIIILILQLLQIKITILHITEIMKVVLLEII